VFLPDAHGCCAVPRTLAPGLTMGAVPSTPSNSDSTDGAEATTMRSVHLEVPFTGGATDMVTQEENKGEVCDRATPSQGGRPHSQQTGCFAGGGAGLLLMAGGSPSKKSTKRLLSESPQKKGARHRLPWPPDPDHESESGSAEGVVGKSSLQSLGAGPPPMCPPPLLSPPSAPSPLGIQVSEEVGVALEVGAAVEVWMPRYRRWVPGVVSSVYPSSATMKLQLPDGNGEVHRLVNRASNVWRFPHAAQAAPPASMAPVATATSASPALLPPRARTEDPEVFLNRLSSLSWLNLSAEAQGAKARRRHRAAGATTATAADILSARGSAGAHEVRRKRWEMEWRRSLKTGSMVEVRARCQGNAWVPAAVSSVRRGSITLRIGHGDSEVRRYVARKSKELRPPTCACGITPPSPPLPSGGGFGLTGAARARARRSWHGSCFVATKNDSPGHELQAQHHSKPEPLEDPLRSADPWRGSRTSHEVPGQHPRESLHMFPLQATPLGGWRLPAQMVQAGIVTPRKSKGNFRYETQHENGGTSEVPLDSGAMQWLEAFQAQAGLQLTSNDLGPESVCSASGKEETADARRLALSHGRLHGQLMEDSLSRTGGGEKGAAVEARMHRGDAAGMENMSGDRAAHGLGSLSLDGGTAAQSLWQVGAQAEVFVSHCNAWLQGRVTKVSNDKVRFEVEVPGGGRWPEWCKKDSKWIRFPSALASAPASAVAAPEVDVGAAPEDSARPLETAPAAGELGPAVVAPGVSTDEIRRCSGGPNKVSWEQGALAEVFIARRQEWLQAIVTKVTETKVRTLVQAPGGGSWPEWRVLGSHEMRLRAPADK